MSGGRTKRVMFLLAPAKTLDFSRAHKDIKTLPATTPRLLNKGTQDLLAILKKQSIADLKSTLKVSPKLAELNYGRYQGFEDAESLQSALCFDGQAYQGLLAWEFDQASLEFLNERLRILSGLYGLIRPFDLTKAYRLEMVGVPTAAPPLARPPRPLALTAPLSLVSPSVRPCAGHQACEPKGQGPLRLLGVFHHRPPS